MIFSKFLTNDFIIHYRQMINVSRIMHVYIIRKYNKQLIVNTFKTFYCGTFKTVLTEFIDYYIYYMILAEI